MTRPGQGVSWALGLVVVLLSSGVSAGLAQSPGTSPLPSLGTSKPQASTRSDACSGRAALPAALDGRPVQETTDPGVSAIDPDDLLDPLLGALGRTRADVCVVTVQYGDGSEALTGQLIRIAGSDAGDLAERLAATLGDRLADLGAQASVSPTVFDAFVVWTLDIVVEGQVTRLVIGHVGDTLLVTSDPMTMRRLLPLLQVAPSPSPSPSSAPASPSG